MLNREGCFSEKEKKITNLVHGRFSATLDWKVSLKLLASLLQ